MIIPKKDAKSYGVVHIKEDFSFVGFCKEITHNKKSSIKIYIDNKLIDEIRCNQFIENIDDLYDLNNESTSFEYQMPLKYLNMKSISFKNGITDEELINSPILINENDEVLNTSKFYYDFLKNKNSNNLKELYLKNTIGFFAVEENLKDTLFIEYINKLAIDNPQVKFKAFYFGNLEKNNTIKLFQNIQIEFIRPKTISNFLENIEVFITTNFIKNKNLIKIQAALPLLSNEILFTLYNNDYINLTIENYIDKKNIKNHPCFLYAKDFNFKEKEIKNSKNSLHLLIYQNLFNKFHIKKELALDSNLYDFEHYSKPLLVIQNKDFKRNLINLQKKIITIREKGLINS